MTQTANITWVLPTERNNGQPQDPAQLDFVAAEFSADLGTNFIPLDQVLATEPQVLVIPDLVDGDYIVRLTVFDKQGKNGQSVDTPFLIDTSAPGTVTNVVVDLV